MTRQAPPGHRPNHDGMVAHHEKDPLRAEVEASPAPAPDPLRDHALPDDAEEFLSYLSVEKGRAPASIAAYRCDLRSFHAFLVQRSVEPNAATAELIEDWLGFQRAAGLKRSSIARALAAVRGYYRFCVDERDLDPDPTEDVASPRVPSGVPKALSEEEVKRLLGAVTGDGPSALRDRAILELLYATGVRISELTALSMEDVDLGAALLVAFGKGSKERFVPIGSYACRAISAWLCPAGRAAMAKERHGRRSDSRAVFISTRGRRMSRQAAWAVVRKYAVAAGLSDRVTPHVLRHSCATHMLDHGADIRVVQEVLGHASIATTQVYTRVSQERLRSAYYAAHPRARLTR